ncbi:MAG TPA: geranylgeranyl reductase family protein [Vicinamibacterales bacterium]|nr:geranylgeranyl reductase family protein [Vicinamibacterales bacterium]
MAFDAVVVGAGPAGAWAAYRLANGGARVAIIDDSHPREKPCGGGITGRALELVAPALSRDRFSGVDIRSATFGYGARQTQVTLARAGLLTVAARRDFDSALLGAATAAGATHIRARARRVERTLTGWTISTGETDVEGLWLFGADGANSFVRRTVHRPFTRSELSIATGYFVRGRTSTDVAIDFEDAPAGYLWSFPRPDHLAVGICAQADEATPGPLQSRVESWIAGRVPGTNRLERYSWPIPSLSDDAVTSELPAGDRWMLLGDAAGLVDPITREGIYFALRSGDDAAESLLGGESPGPRYTQRVRDGIHDELRRAARFKARFYRAPFMNLLVTALDRSARIRDVMADLVGGRQSYRGLKRRLVGTLEWRLMWDVLGPDALCPTTSPDSHRGRAPATAGSSRRR